MALPTMRSSLVSREYLRIGGGYGAGQEGTSPAGGLDVDNGGNLATDGDVTIKGVLSAGSTPQALTNSAGLIDGGKIQAGTVDTAELADDAVTPSKLDELADFAMNTLQLGANVIKNSQGEATITLSTSQSVTLHNDLFFSSGSNIGTDTDTNLLTISDNVLGIAGTLEMSSGRNSYVDVTADKTYIFKTYSSGGAYPFNAYGHLVLQPRANQRDLVVATGASGNIATRLVVDWVGNVTVSTGNLTISNGGLTVAGTLTANGNAALGNSSTDTITCTGRLIVRSVNDAGMDATSGSYGEIVINQADNKFYGCTSSGTSADWAVLG